MIVDIPGSSGFRAMLGSEGLISALITAIFFDSVLLMWFTLRK